MTACKDELIRLQNELEAWMVEHGDLALNAFRNRQTPEALTTFMKEQEVHGIKLREQGDAPISPGFKPQVHH